MTRKGTSSRWYQRQVSDPFVKAREQQGLRSRAAFKLTELIERDRLLRPGGVVLDLGASPGGWSQVAAPAVGPRGLVVAVDLLPMIPLPGVHFILGDCREDAIIEAVAASLGARAADLVLSDMAPNLSGIRSADEARSLELVAVAFEACQRFLKPGGTLLVKAFQHEETERFLRGQRNAFEKIARRKPAASRRESREFYVVAAGFKG